VRLFDWRNTLTIVKPDTLIPLASQRIPPVLEMEISASWPRIPADLQKLIAEMAVNDPIWGEERIADELLLKIGIRISPRTIRRYMSAKPS